MESNNKLIAEFMGGITSSVPNLINLPQTRGDANIHSVKGSEVLPNGTYSVHRLNELKYHSSWKWLKPVVEKIWHKSDMWDISDIDDDECTNIADALYNAVVEFIKNQKNN